MPEFSVIHFALAAITTVIGAILGWFFRNSRAKLEKAAVNTGWQNQIGAQRKEGDRLVEQNKGLMEQVSQFQASHTDAKNRAKELSTAVQEAYGRRDELQREIKDIRGNLEVAINERDQLQSDIAAHGSAEAIVREKDARIESLKQELDRWQNRLPPLIERFRVRDEEAEQLEAELKQARERIRDLEREQKNVSDSSTRIEPVTDPEELTDGLDASNDEDTSMARLLQAEVESELDEIAEPPTDDSLEDVEAELESAPEFEDESESHSDTEPSSGAHRLRDNLKLIKGVGPAIEKTLNEMGIVSFRQIADMSEYDIDRVARRLKGFHSRIYREDWIGQARELLDPMVRA